MSPDQPNNQNPNGLDEILRSLHAVGRSVTEKLEPVVNAVSKLLPVLAQTQPYIEALLRANKIIDSLAKTGWLPYHTIGIDYIEESFVGEYSLESRVAEYYEKNWMDIRSDIESRMVSYQISEDAKETLLEAMTAHELGLYRCVCRVLFPEIDRELRIQFFKDKTGTIKSDDMLKALANRGTLDDYLPRSLFSYILIGRLIDHLYEPITRANRSKFELDDVPNRHAAMHGLVRYTTYKHSMNMLIMTDYIFEILTLTAHLPYKDK